MGNKASGNFESVSIATPPRPSRLASPAVEGPLSGKPTTPSAGVQRNRSCLTAAERALPASPYTRRLPRYPLEARHPERRSLARPPGRPAHSACQELQFALPRIGPPRKPAASVGPQTPGAARLSCPPVCGRLCRSLARGDGGDLTAWRCRTAASLGGLGGLGGLAASTNRVSPARFVRGESTGSLVMLSGRSGGGLRRDESRRAVAKMEARSAEAQTSGSNSGEAPTTTAVAVVTAAAAAAPKALLQRKIFHKPVIRSQDEQALRESADKCAELAILYKSVPELRKLTRLLDKFERLFAILPQNLRHVMDQLLDFELIAENCTGRPSRGQPEAGRRSHSRQLLILRQNEEIVAHLLPRMHRHQLAAQELGHVLHRMEEKLQVYSKALYQLAAWHLLLEPAVTAGLSETSGRESLAEPMLRDHEADSAASKDAGSGKTA